MLITISCLTFYFLTNCNLLSDCPFQETGAFIMRDTGPAHKADLHDKPFKPAKEPPQPVKALFEHAPDYTVVKKNFRDEEGNVVIAPPNIRTNPPKKGKVGKNTIFGQYPSHLADDYEAPKKLANKERAEHLSKVQEKPFSQRIKHTETFNKPLNVYGENPPVPAREPKAKPAPPMEHDKAFKPSNPPRIGYNKTINKFPEYKEDPPKRLTRKIVVEGEDEGPKFKSTYKERSRPTPSIATNFRNLKASFPSAFRR